MSKLLLKDLEDLAWQYVNECLTNTKQHPTASGKVVNILDRKTPTVSYFLRYWIPAKGKPTIARSTWYEWLKHEEKSDTIKKIKDLFDSIAIDIIANEGKSIFWAKNALGWSDQLKTSTHIEQPLFILNEED